jgi:pSer/pThr/pTyr-binding forkhead associated (FHA) protein
VRLTITILSGTRAGQRILLASGETLRVGRTSKAGISIADDPTMSSVHYEVLCDEAGAFICDLESRNGLFVNGEPVKQVTLNSGDQIRAGRTFFSVALEGSGDGCCLDDETQAPADATRAVLSPVAARMMPPLEASCPTGDRHRTKAGQTEGPAPDRSNDPLLPQPLVRSTGGLYAVADGVLAQALLQQAKHHHRRAESLLAGGTSPYLAAVAPYLIEIEDEGVLSIWRPMLNHGNGIVVESNADFDEVVVHARSIFCGRDDVGRPSYFRFYDSRLLYAWLWSCHGPQLESFFGCFTCVILALEDGSRWMRLTHADGELGAEEIYAP